MIGWFWLAGHDAVLWAVMLFAAGGILYLTFQDIAPQSRLGTALGAAARRRAGIRARHAGRDRLRVTAR